MDYLRGIFKWQIRSTDSPRYFRFVSQRLAFSWTEELHSHADVSGTLCLDGCQRERALLSVHEPPSHSVYGSAREREWESARAFALTVSWQLEGGGASRHKLSIFCVFCFDVLRANGWNVLFLNARGGHSPLHLFISYFNLNSIVLYLKDLMTVRKLSGSNCYVKNCRRFLIQGKCFSGYRGRIALQCCRWTPERTRKRALDSCLTNLSHFASCLIRTILSGVRQPAKGWWCHNC